jgi:drug/metabolite transporter (DMT)-like permease
MTVAAPEPSSPVTGRASSSLPAAYGFRRAALMMLGASALLAMTSLLAKALGRGIHGPELHPFQISAGRFCFALAGLAAVGLWLRPSFAGAAWGLHVTRSLCGWLSVSCMFAAAVRMPLAEATAITFLNPLATMALAIPLLGERVLPLRWIAASIAVVGALILIRPGADAFQPAALIALAAAIFIGVEVILIKQLSGREPPLRILIINNAMGAAIAAIAAAFYWTSPTPAQWIMLALLGLIMACAQGLFIQAMKGVEAGHVVPVSYTTLVFAALYDVAAFGDWPDAVSLVGMLVILAGVMLLALPWAGVRRG